MVFYLIDLTNIYNTLWQKVTLKDENMSYFG